MHGKQGGSEQALTKISFLIPPPDGASATGTEVVAVAGRLAVKLEGAISGVINKLD